MKKIFSILSLVIGLSVFAQKAPAVLKTEFPAQALQDEVETKDGQLVSLQKALEKYNGKIVVLDLYAVWCGDCIKGMPKLKELQQNNPDVTFVYLSMDRSQDAWKEGIEKYNIQGEYLYLGNNWKGNFATSIDLNWIPRYLVLDQKGKIAKYYAVNADNPTVQSTIDQLRKK